MPRKSRELRLQQTTLLLEKYLGVGLDNDYRGRFIHDMCRRLELSKGLSKKQRDWLDSLIEEGAPQPMGDPVLIAKIQDSMEVDGMQHRAGTLSDFLYKIRRGWSLSEKQGKFLDIMLAEAEKIRTTGRWSPDDELCSKLKMAVLITRGRNGGGWYLGHRPGTAKAFDRIEKWFMWKRQEEENDGLRDGRPNVERVDEPPLDEWACDKLLNSCKKEFTELENPKHPAGSIRYHRFDGRIVLISDVPHISDINDMGKVLYPCLSNGELITIEGSLLLKRRPKINHLTSQT